MSGQGARPKPASETSGASSERADVAPSATPDTLTAALGAKLESGKAELIELKDTVTESLASGFEDAKAAVSEVAEKVEDVARDVGGKFEQAARSTVSVIRANPIPAAMVGIGGIGLAMLLMNAKSSSDAGATSPGKARKRRSNGADGAGTGKQLANMAQRARTSFGDMKTSSGAALRRTGTQARAKAQRIGRVIEQNPIPVSAGALAVGVGIGLMLPRTQTEDQWLGSTRDSLIAKGHTLASKALDKVETARQLVTGDTAATEPESAVSKSSQHGAK